MDAASASCSVDVGMSVPPPLMPLNRLPRGKTASLQEKHRCKPSNSREECGRYADFSLNIPFRARSVSISCPVLPKMCCFGQMKENSARNGFFRSQIITNHGILPMPEPMVGKKRSSGVEDATVVDEQEVKKNRGGDNGGARNQVHLERAQRHEVAVTPSCT